MAENQLNGRSLSAIAKDVADGFVSISPQLLKRFNPENYKELRIFLKKAQNDIRSQSFPTSDTNAIRKRNMRLQRLHQAVTVLEFSAKERRVSLI